MGSLQELLEIIARMDDTDELRNFFGEIFTPKELRDSGLRWQLLRELFKGEKQRVIASRLRISLCKITRSSKILKKEGSISRKILKSRIAV